MFSIIKKISALSGHGRNGSPQPLGCIDMAIGQDVSIVEPSGSRKTTLVNDLDRIVDADTPSGWRILINGRGVRPEFRYNLPRNPIALIQEAIAISIPLDEIEKYLDWLDAARIPSLETSLATRGSGCARR